MNWRFALVLGAIFLTVGVIYWWVQQFGNKIDLTGATLLVVLGCAMAFGFSVLLRGSRDL